MKPQIEIAKVVRHLRMEMKWLKDAVVYYAHIEREINMNYFRGRLKSINETIAWLEEQQRKI